MKKKLTFNEEGVNFLAKARKNKNVIVQDSSVTDIAGLFHLDAQIWSTNHRALTDLSQTCPVEFTIQEVYERTYMMQLYGVAKSDT